VANHCSVYALSDPLDLDFQQKCDHEHNDRCSHCEGLNAALLQIKATVESVNFHTEEDRDESFYLYQTAADAINAWKAHQLRSVRQDQGRIDVLDILDSKTVLIVNDWAMKFLPQRYRESQQDWFGKRGISWHIAVVFRRIDGHLQSQSFVHVMQSCTQDSTAVIQILQHVLKTLKIAHPEIERAFFRQDNAGCYHSSSTILATQQISETTGIDVTRTDFSDPQGGKGAADRMAARCKSHIRIYINEGNNVTTAKQMKTALLSHGGLEGVRVAVVETTSSSQEHQKITGINKLNNFKRMEGGLVAWRAYGIGTGKLINFCQVIM